MVNRTATATALLLLGLAAVSIAPTASAAYNQCTNEASDTDVLGLKILGVDGPITDGNGIQVCLFDRDFDVETNPSVAGVGGWGGPNPPPPGVGVTVRVCEGFGATYADCDDTTAGSMNVVVLDWTGVTLFCRPGPLVSACVWADGIPIELNP